MNYLLQYRLSLTTAMMVVGGVTYMLRGFADPLFDC